MFSNNFRKAKIVPSALVFLGICTLLAASPDDVPGLVLWVKAETVAADLLNTEESAGAPTVEVDRWQGAASETNGAGRLVARWPDLSPRGHHLYASREKAPLVMSLFGRPVVYFDGGSWLENSEFSLGDTDGMTLFIVGNHDPVQNNEPWPYLLSFTRETPYFPGSVRAQRVGDRNLMRIYIPDAEMGREIDWNTRGLNILSATLDAATGRHRLFSFGEEVASEKADIAEAFSRLKEPTSLLLGATWGWGSVRGFWQGAIAEVAIYDRVLDEGERRGVETYLRKKYSSSGNYLTPLASRLPFAYYPSRNALQVAGDIEGALAWLPPAAREEVGNGLSTLGVGIRTVDGENMLFEGIVPLDDTGRGEVTLALPGLPDGEYAVEYRFGETAVRSPKTFTRRHFVWADNSLGLRHTVYPPFEPVQVDGDTARVVGRVYRINGFGLFDSVRALDRELLAAPMQLKHETAAGTGKWSKRTVSGRVIHPDLAVFDASAESGPVTVTTRSSIEEDGCVKVEMTLAPGASPREIKRLWVEIPLKDAEVPLCHFASQGLRNNYGGNTPRGGKIVWDVTSQTGTPPVWRAEPGPEDGEIWNATQFKTWGAGKYPVTMRSFIPYIWLGAEERGLAWFGENAHGYVESFDAPAQTLAREGDRVVLRVHLIQRPVILKTPRQIVFGLQASPTKPMESRWRMRRFPTGWEAVTPWGGYACSSKYPDGRDFSVVEKLVEAGRTGVVDREFFAAKDKQRVQQDRLVQGGRPWLEKMLWFANQFAHGYRVHGQALPLATYFEEHATDQTYLEWQVFMDEWCNKVYNRFHKRPSSWDGFPRSYQDFAVHYANEYLRRGVGIYLDNCYLKWNYNTSFYPAYVGRDGGRRPAVPLWDQRAYYKRLWRQVQYWNARDTAPYPLHMYLHKTNTQILPLNTWSSVALDQEQVYRDRNKEHPAESPPWPPDYLRAVTLGRQIGSIPTALNPLRNVPLDRLSDRGKLSNWGMHTVHEIYPYSGIGGGGALSSKYQAVFRQFGYPQAMPGARSASSNVTIHNYWENPARVMVEKSSVKWLALERQASPSGLLLLQSYERNDAAAKVRFPGRVTFVDVETREVLRADRDGWVDLTLPANYGTRLFQVTRPDEPHAATPPDTLL
ncbi:MAG: LamG domain-containing protein, partial [Candidatus Pacebacteria bacterium]|nr:LamG domain-containing protein [Candidatus Paceibacterota bacterium]